MEIAKKQRNLLIFILLFAYIGMLIVFAMSIFGLPGEYTALEKKYVEDLQSAMVQIFHDAASEQELSSKLTQLVEEFPMEIIVTKDNKRLFATTSQTVEQLYGEANKTVTLMQKQNIYEVKNTKYNVFFSVYHVQTSNYLTHLAYYQIVLIGISIFIILTLTAFMIFILYQSLTKVKDNLKKAENYEFEAVINQTTNDGINERLRLFVANLDQNVKILSRDFTELEQALQIEHERLENTINVSSAFVHDLKSPLHQLLLTNESMLKKEQEATEIVAVNIVEIEKIIRTINEILTLMDENIFDMNKEKEVVDFVGLLDSAYKMFLPIVQKQKVYFDLEIPDQLYTYISIPTAKLLIHNIIANATQYVTPHTEIICGIKELADEFIFYCTNETAENNITRLQESEHIFLKKKVEDEQHQFSSGKGLFLIKELASALEGEYQLKFDANIVMVEIRLPKNVVNDALF